MRGGQEASYIERFEGLAGANRCLIQWGDRGAMGLSGMRCRGMNTGARDQACFHIFIRRRRSLLPSHSEFPVSTSSFAALINSQPAFVASETAASPQVLQALDAISGYRPTTFPAIDITNSSLANLSACSQTLRRDIPHSSNSMMTTHHLVLEDFP
ncbi:hypothetical protein BJ508DRAFT_416713 [Ascobolus immersus RN42]|uniref:Uncharacterized protein n=1 Tax=Ascobolus immersus RN42 TaxID=1160509 RepID=A0A3N4I1V7_ASCIM|nr:hypothetical protein BJ508DRAFT_416713 [Ascobolus immersus RN42]